MKQPRNFFEQLKDPAFHDRKSTVLLDSAPGRLSFSYANGRGDWNSVAAMIRRFPPQLTNWFPDANVVFLSEAESVWEAFRVAGLGLPGGVAGLTQVVLAEMDEWLKLPYRLKDRARRINDAIQCKSWLRTIQKPIFPYGLGIRGYMMLLGFRRGLASPRGDGSAFVGTRATDKCTTMNEIEAQMGRRALGLAKKGRIDAERKGGVDVSDELHCLIVIVNALLSRQASLILTADEDYIEIFSKAAWFLDAHYRAWLAAKLICDGRYGDPLKITHSTHGFFKGPLTLFRRPTDNLQEVLPPLYETVRVGVLHVKSGGRIDYLSFGFERQMLEMLKIRGASNGRCTELFGTANIHVDLGPLRRGLPCLCLGVGQDDGIEVQSLGHTMFLSKLDLLHCIHCKERFAR